MSTRFKFLLVSVFVVSLFTSVIANDLIRVKFRKGTYGKNIIGYLKDYSAEKTYVLWAKEGQTLSVRQINSKSSQRLISLRIQTPSGEDISDLEASCNSRKKVVLPESGDYQIKVFECQKADEWKGQFKLNITVK